MGRQIHFHMLPEDQKVFLSFVMEHDPVVITPRGLGIAALEQLNDLGSGGGQTLSLWNRELLPHLERKWIPEPGYFRVDGLNTPTLEFMPSFTTTWEGKPALGQGRLFGNFESHLNKSPKFEKWYETLVRWVQKNLKRSPTSIEGYVGSAAYEFYERGAYLLPNIVPPASREWVAEIGKQHANAGIPSAQ